MPHHRVRTRQTVVVLLALVAALLVLAPPVGPAGAVRADRVGSDHTAAKKKVRLEVVPGAAEVGQTVTLKGRVTGGKRGKKKVTVYAGAAAVSSFKTKRSGKFKTTATVPAERRFKVCSGKRCDRVTVDPPPDTISYAWTQEDGYAFSTQVTGMTVRDVRTDTLNQKPGEAEISFELTADQVVTNRTPNRNASPEWTSLRAVYPAASTLCQATLTGTNRSTNLLEVELGTHSPGSPTSSTVDTPYCWFGDYLSGARGEGVDTLGPGESRYNEMIYTDAFDNEYDVSFIVPEPSAAAVVAELRQPAFWILSRGLGGPQGEYAFGTCRAGVPVVATSKAGAGVCAQGVQ